MATTSAVMSRPSWSGPAAMTNAQRAGSLITTGTKQLPNRYILHAVEGWGKTSFGAQMPKPVFMQSRGETGLETLIDSGQLPEIPHTPEITQWADALYTMEYLLQADHGFQTLCVDTINGLERLCFESVCERDFGGKWGNDGFASYGKGPQVAQNDWRQFLIACDALREKRKMRIIMLCHTKVGTYQNPTGANYDRFSPEMAKETWGLTHKWADCVFFGNFESIVIGGQVDGKQPRKGKGIGGRTRMMYTIRHDAYDAKNRLGLPPEIEMGDTPQEGYQRFLEAVKSGRGVTVATAVTTQEGN